jgi:hypothetical protein
MAIRGLKFSTEVVAAFNRRDAARLVRQITDALAESNGAVNVRVALANGINGPEANVGVVGNVSAVSAPLRTHRSVLDGVIVTGQVGS